MSAPSLTSAGKDKDEVRPRLHRFVHGFRGYLVKQGRVFKQWQRRYFVLSKKTLRYYADESCAVLQGEIKIDENTKLFDIQEELGDRTNLFYIMSGAKSVPSVKTNAEAMLLSAASEKDKTDWMEAITDSVHNGFKQIFQPDIWPKEFYPTVEMSVVYPHSPMPAYNGNVLRPQFLENPPEIKIEGVNPDEKFSFIMIDADPAGNSNKNDSFFLHWCVQNFSASDINSGEVLAPYVPPAPAWGSGSHRIFFLLFRQRKGPAQIVMSEFVDVVFQNREGFPLRTWVKRMNFGVPAAMNGFYVGWEDCVDRYHRKMNYLPPGPYRSPHQVTSMEREAELQRIAENRVQLYEDFSLSDVFNAQLQELAHQGLEPMAVSLFFGEEKSPVRDYAVLPIELTRQAPRVEIKGVRESDMFTLFLCDLDSPSRFAPFLSSARKPSSPPSPTTSVVVNTTTTTAGTRGVVSPGGPRTPGHSHTPTRSTIASPTPSSNTVTALGVNSNANNTSANTSFVGEAQERETVLWCVANIPAGRISEGETLCEYWPPAPMYASGLHRCVLVVYAQTSLLTESQINEAKAFFSASERERVSSFAWVQRLSPRVVAYPAALSVFLSKWEPRSDELQEEREKAKEKMRLENKEKEKERTLDDKEKEKEKQREKEKEKEKEYCERFLSPAQLRKRELQHKQQQLKELKQLQTELETRGEGEKKTDGHDESESDPYAYRRARTTAALSSADLSLTELLDRFRGVSARDAAALLREEERDGQGKGGEAEVKEEGEAEHWIAAAPGMTTLPVRLPRRRESESESDALLRQWIEHCEDVDSHSHTTSERALEKVSMMQSASLPGLPDTLPRSPVKSIVRERERERERNLKSPVPAPASISAPTPAAEKEREKQRVNEEKKTEIKPEPKAEETKTETPLPTTTQEGLKGSRGKGEGERDSVEVKLEKMTESDIKSMSTVSESVSVSEKSNEDKTRGDSSSPPSASEDPSPNGTQAKAQGEKDTNKEKEKEISIFEPEPLALPPPLSQRLSLKKQQPSRMRVISRDKDREKEKESEDSAVSDKSFSSGIFKSIKRTFSSSGDKSASKSPRPKSITPDVLEEMLRGATTFDHAYDSDPSYPSTPTGLNAFGLHHISTNDDDSSNIPTAKASPLTTFKPVSLSSNPRDSDREKDKDSDAGSSVSAGSTNSSQKKRFSFSLSGMSKSPTHSSVSASSLGAIPAGERALEMERGRNLTQTLKSASSAEQKCAVFDVTTPSIFDGETLHKKLTGDYFAKESTLWVDTTTRTLHWAKSQQERRHQPQHCKYILLDTHVADASPKALGEKKGVMKSVELNGLSVMLTLESGEHLELKVGNDHSAVQRAADWAKVLRTFLY